MKGKKWLVVLISLAVVLLASSVGITRSSFVDLESSTGNTFQAWNSTAWVQTSQADFENGVLDSYWATRSTGAGSIAVSNAGSPQAGNFHLKD